MTTHMTVNDLHDIMQSSYKEKHSAMYICMDLSVAFDTVDHEILLNHIKKCLKYLNNRKHTVIINALQSPSRVVTCGVPQGSILGPKLYNIYTLPISDIVKKHKVQVMLYADDGHLYVCFKPTDTNVTRIQMETLAADLNDWFIANNLMSNNNKLVALLINEPCRTFYLS